MPLVKLVIPMWGVIPDLEFEGRVDNEFPQPPNRSKVVLTGNPGEELFAQDNNNQIYHLYCNKDGFYWS